MAFPGSFIRIIEYVMEETFKKIGFFFPHPRIISYPGWRWLILCTVLIGATMSALDVSIVNVAMPTLKHTFGVSMTVIEWVAMAYMLTLTIFLPFFGRLADMFGRSRLYNLGFVVFAVGSFLCGMAGVAVFLIAARVVQAIGAGLLQANSVAIITEAFPACQRGKAIGIQGAVQAISMSLGPFVGGILIAAVGWRFIFYVNVPIGAIGTIAALFILPRASRKSKKEKIDYLGTALFAGGLASVVMAFNKVADLGWTSPFFLAYLFAGVLLLVAFVVTEFKVEHPMIDPQLFRNIGFLFGNVSGMMSYYVLFAALFLLPFYFQDVLGYGASVVGLLLTPVPLAMAIVAPFAGHVSDMHGPRVITTAGMLVSASSCLILMFEGTSARLPFIVSAMVLMGIGMGLFTSPNNSAIMGSAPEEKLGVAGGILNMMRSLGLIFGVDISGTVLTALENQYLVGHGSVSVAHLAGRTGTSPIESDAFMHGFVAVMGILLAINLIAAFFSAIDKAERGAGISGAPPY